MRDGKDIVFVVAVGRSGTKWLANIVGGVHEPPELNSEDDFNYFHSVIMRTNPIWRERVKYIRNMKGKKYIEVNGYLRRFVPQLREWFPGCRVIQLVRNPIDVIRSIMSRNHGMMVKVSRKIKVDPFTVTCMLWAEDNKHMRMNCDETFRLEDLTNNYTRYCDLKSLIGLSQDSSVWEAQRKNKINKSAEIKFPSFTKWTADEKRIFKTFCAKEAAYYGYWMAE